MSYLSFLDSLFVVLFFQRLANGEFTSELRLQSLDLLFLAGRSTNNENDRLSPRIDNLFGVADCDSGSHPIQERGASSRLIGRIRPAIRGTRAPEESQSKLGLG